MKKLILILLLAIGFASATDCSDPNYYILRLKIKQTTFTLDIWEHAKNEMNAIEMSIPVEKSFWENQRSGNKLSDQWKPGSLLFNGDFSKLVVSVVGKEAVRKPECR